MEQHYSWHSNNPKLCIKTETIVIFIGDLNCILRLKKHEIFLTEEEKLKLFQDLLWELNTNYFLNATMNLYDYINQSCM